MTLRRECLSAGAAALVLPMLWSCGHSDAMRDVPPGATEPLDPRPPVQLTYSPAVDGEARMLADSSVIYSFTTTDALQRDRCLGVLRISGGTRLDEHCARGPNAEDSTQVYRLPVPLSGDSLAWFRASRPIGTDFDREAAVVVGSRAEPAGFRVQRSFPTTSTAGQIHLEPAALSVVGGGQLAYVGMRFYQNCGPTACDPILYFSGREIALLDLAEPGAPPVAVPGTNYASSVTAGPSAGEIAYTLAGDSRVYLRTTSGTLSVLHDFNGRIARDVHIAAGHLAAVVGGSVFAFVNHLGDTIQVDDGGTLVVVNLATHAEWEADGPPVRRPVLTPTARGVIVEIGNNLYRYDLP